jgi:hypothetical protein
LPSARRLETVYAHIIGATDPMRRPFTQNDLLRRIHAFEAQHRIRPEGAVASESISMAVEGQLEAALVRAFHHTVAA